jgi:hypothetical protein
MNNNIDRIFIKFQLWWFSIFLLGVIVGALYQVIGESQSLSSVTYSLGQYVKIFYLPGLLTLLLFHCLFRMIIPLQFYFYYYVWIKHVWIKRIYSTLKRRVPFPYSKFKGRLEHRSYSIFDDYGDSLIRRSFPEKILEECHLSKEYSNKVQEMSLKNRPVLIRREHLMKKGFWPKWAFATVLLFNKLIIQSYHATHGEIKYCLKVDLRNQSYGIYNNAGKLFLKCVFLNDDFKSRCVKMSIEIEDFLKGKTSQGDVLPIDAKKMPFRWASGGVLPIVLWNNRFWYVLFFRDIEPVGLNIANGASETKEEYKDLDSLAYREFSEELVLLNREPSPSDNLPVTQKIFRYPHPLPPETSDKITSNEFAQKHKKLRKEHDGLPIEFDTDGPELKPINTPFEVEVSPHDTNQLYRSPKVSNVVFNVNPTEFGIEVLRVSYFEMDKDDYLMDGEIWEMGPALVRQPIMLLSCDYIQSIFNKNGSIGTYVEKAPYLNCKYLENIPYSEYKIFDKDIEFRQRRLELLEKDSKTKEFPEVERYKAWLEKYGELFRMVKESKCDLTNNDHKPLVTLCPVTWKTLEMICHHKLLNNIKLR